MNSHELRKSHLEAARLRPQLIFLDDHDDRPNHSIQKSEATF